MDLWKHHVEHTVAYAQAAKAKDRPKLLSALMHLVSGVGLWGEMIFKKHGHHNALIAHGLMAEHVIGAKLLADQSPANDAPSVTTALQLLSRNADFQAMFFGAMISSFPHSEFRKLLGDHLTATAGYVKDLAAGDEASFQSHVAAARKNAADLDVFTARQLLVHEKALQEA